MRTKTNDLNVEISDEEKLAVDKGLDDIKAGRGKPHKEARKLHEKWF